MNRKITIFICLSLLYYAHLNAQNYVGGGNNQGIKVYAGHQYQNPDWIKAAEAGNTINGIGLDAKLLEASRFLSQATIGFDESDMNKVVDLGIEGWIDEQMQMATTFILPKTEEIYQIMIDSVTLNAPENLNEHQFRPPWSAFSYAYWDIMMKNNDLLRHRVALALTEIFVISKNPHFITFGDGLASYYDMLSTNAFGNYENLLLDVSLHPCMGKYLSHFQNQKANPAENIHPDENYAREIMQLFSIGLYELNPDGSRILDESGDFMPTYGQAEIKEFAKIFTGLGAADTVPNPYGGSTVIDFSRNFNTTDVTVPMKMYDDFHEPGAKNLLKGKVVPGGQSGMKDIKDAIHNLYQHPNVGPFIGYRLIQRLVKSNPSPAYVSRITKVFNNNGKGVRGDMAAVVKAILMDGEARACSFLSDEKNGRLKEPLIRYSHFARAVSKFNPFDYYWNINWDFATKTGQDIFNSPSVFNFYLPDHSPIGCIADNDLVAPEYKIHNTQTGPGYMNAVDRITNFEEGYIMSTWEKWGLWDCNRQVDTCDYSLTRVALKVQDYLALSRDPEAFINELDRLFTHGTMSENTRTLIRDSMNQIPPSGWYDYEESRISLAFYILLISPDYAVMR